MNASNFSFLRGVLLADAGVSGAAGLLMVVGAGIFSPLLNLPEDLLRNSGLFLIVYGALVGYLGKQTSPTRPAVWAVIIANALWVLDSILILVLGWVQPSALGYAFVIFQAVVVAVLAELEYIGLKRASVGVARAQS